MDDIFGDLLPARKIVPAASDNCGNSKDAAGTDSVSLRTKLGTKPSQIARAPDMFSDMHEETKDESVSTAGVLCTLSREDLQQLLQETVQGTVEATFGKFARSLRTVLEDMSRRIDASVQQHTELRGSLDGLKDVLAGQAENVNARFTSLDMAVREAERGIQALRDKQELHEAQAMLAKFSAPTSEDKKAVDAVPASAAGASAPGESGSLQAAAAAPVPVQAPAPAQATAPAPAQQIQAQVPAAIPVQASAPAPMMHAAAPMSVAPVQYQPSYQQQTAPPQHLQPVQHQPTGNENQYAGPPGAQVPAYAYRVPESPSGVAAVPAMQQLPQQQHPGPDPYMMPHTQQQHPPTQQQHPPTQQQHPPTQQQQQHMQLAPQQQQQHVPQQQMGPGYAPQPYPQAQPMAPPVQPVPPRLPQQGPPVMSAPMQSMPSQGPVYPMPTMPSYPGMPYRQPSMQHGPAAMPAPTGPPLQSKTTSRAVPLEQIITDITNMGFERHQVMSLINNLQKNGQAIDLNVILDKLTRGDYS